MQEATFYRRIFPSLDESLEETTLEEEAKEDIPEISFNALSGNTTPQTMWFLGKPGNSVISIWVDSGSTHDFLNPKIATKQGIFQTKKGEFSVLVANGSKMKSEELCENLHIFVQKVQFDVDFFLLPVEGCDAVFGTQWLKQSGKIVWEFNELWMQFCWKGKSVELRSFLEDKETFKGKGVVMDKKSVNIIV